MLLEAKRAVRLVGAAAALSFMLALMAGVAAAEPVLSLGTVFAASGATFSLPVTLSGGTEPYSAIRLEVTVPPGFSVSLNPTSHAPVVALAAPLTGYKLCTALSEAGDAVTVLAYSIDKPTFDASTAVKLMDIKMIAPSAPVTCGVPLVSAATDLAARDGDQAALGLSDGLAVIGGQAQPALKVSPDSWPVSAAAGQCSFTIGNGGVGNMPFTVQLASGADWVTLAGDSSGTNSGQITATYQKNLSADQRKAQIVVTAPAAVISPVQVTIVQAGGTAQLSVTPETVPRVGAGSGIIDLNVANTGSGTLNWTARVIQGNEWLHVTAGAAGAQDGIVTVEYAGNQTLVARSGVVAITASGALGGYVERVINQDPPPILSVVPIQHTLASTAASVSSSVTNAGAGTLNWQATILAGAGWLTLSGATKGLVDSSAPIDTVGFSVTANSGAASRTGIIRVQSFEALGSPIDIQVVQATGTVTVPNVVGQMQTAAGNTLAGANLTTGAVTQQCSSSVAAGLVISQNPLADQQAAAGSAVALTVSTGPCTQGEGEGENTPPTEAQLRGQLEEGFDTMDGGGDGQVSYAEALTALPGLRQAVFNAVDTNGDGQISRAEAGVDKGGCAGCMGGKSAQTLEKFKNALDNVFLAGLSLGALVILSRRRTL